MIMTDQDHDGSHIKGLLINFFENFWPNLIKKPGFLKEFVTPIIKVTKRSGNITGKKFETFFTISEYKVWEEKLVK
jgi:DNA topoisomerase-2